VGSTPRPVTTRDTVLLIVHAAGDIVAGRTVMQKLAYFAGLGRPAPLGHKPHYYGPYSSQVEDAVGNAVIAGELRETVERMPGWGRGPDVLKYTYELEAAGKTRVDRLIEDHHEEWDTVRDAVNAIKQVVPTLDQKTLSTAAKTHLIVIESAGEDGVVPLNDIPELAKSLGWDISPEQVETTVELLGQLGLVARTESKVL
jgi:uncharacterized protein YwgA